MFYKGSVFKFYLSRRGEAFVRFVIFSTIHIAYSYLKTKDVNHLPLVGYIGFAVFIGVICFMLFNF
jgi:hypothetical protein